MSTFKSKVEMTDAVVFRIHGHREDKKSARLRYEVAKDNLLMEFLAWVGKHPELDIRIQSSGLGSCSCWAPIESKEEITNFFRTQKAKIL